MLLSAVIFAKLMPHSEACRDAEFNLPTLVFDEAVERFSGAPDQLDWLVGMNLDMIENCAAVRQKYGW